MQIIHKDDAHILDIIRPDIKKGPWIAGGAVLQWINGQNIGLSDIDVYFKSQEQLDTFVNKIINNKKKSDDSFIKSTFGFIQSEPLKWSIVSSTEFAKTYRYYPKNDAEYIIIQLIIKDFYDTPEDVINEFDITVCQLVTDGYNLRYGEKTMADIKNKRLRFNTIKPAMIKRMMKYWTYGYTPDNDILDQIRTIPDIDETYENSMVDYTG